jgi:hypothetical protein
LASPGSANSSLRRRWRRATRPFSSTSADGSMPALLGGLPPCEGRYASGTSCQPSAALGELGSQRLALLERHREQAIQLAAAGVFDGLFRPAQRAVLECFHRLELVRGRSLGILDDGEPGGDEQLGVFWEFLERLSGQGGTPVWERAFDQPLPISYLPAAADERVALLRSMSWQDERGAHGPNLRRRCRAARERARARSPTRAALRPGGR